MATLISGNSVVTDTSRLVTLIFISKMKKLIKFLFYNLYIQQMTQEVSMRY